MFVQGTEAFALWFSSCHCSKLLLLLFLDHDHDHDHDTLLNLNFFKNSTTLLYSLGIVHLIAGCDQKVSIVSLKLSVAMGTLYNVYRDSYLKFCVDTFFQLATISGAAGRTKRGFFCILPVQTNFCYL